MGCLLGMESTNGVNTSKGPSGKPRSVKKMAGLQALSPMRCRLSGGQAAMSSLGYMHEETLVHVPHISAAKMVQAR
jgi:hypothetical protein